MTRIAINLPAGMEPPTVVIPYLFDINNNRLKVAERQAPSVAHGIVNQLNRFYMEHFGTQPGTLKERRRETANGFYCISGECSLFPAIRHIMMSDCMP